MALISGLIASSSYHPLHFWPGVFIGIALLYRLNQESDIKARIKLNIIFGFGFQILTLHWIGTFVGAYAWLALVGMQATFFIVLSFTRGPFGFALSWVVFELILRSFPFGGFGWSRIGFALTESPINFLYPRISIVGIAFIVTLISAYTIERRTKSLVFSVLLLLLIGMIQVNVIKGPPIRVGLIQGGQSEKMNNTFASSEATISKHFAATEMVKPKTVDLVIWPENAVTHDPFLKADTFNGLNTSIRRLSAPILLNANLSDGTNGTILIGAGKTQIYSKRYLTPFGEFVPFRPLVSKISDQSRKVVDYIPGDKPVLFLTNKGTFRTLICYELLSDKQARSEMKDANFIVAQTNNATFFKTWQLEQEIEIAKARSAETSRETAYVSTTGITGIIDNSGKLTDSLPKYTNGALVAEVTTRSGVTPAVQFGSKLEFIFLVLWLFLLVPRRTFWR